MTISLRNGAAPTGEPGPRVTPPDVLERFAELVKDAQREPQQRQAPAPRELPAQQEEPPPHHRRGRR